MGTASESTNNIEDERINSHHSSTGHFRLSQHEEDIHPIVSMFRLIFLFFEQVLILCQKHVSQKQRNGRQFWKDTIMIQFFTLLFVYYILSNASTPTPDSEVYNKFQLPPLSDSKPYGIFNADSKGNNQYTIISKRLYYSPNNHEGIQSMIDALVLKYPDVKPVGAADYDEILILYQENLFDSWAALVFNLNDEQITTQKLIPDETTQTTVQYGIYINPINWGNGYIYSNFTTNIYNKQSCDADLFWSSGYLTLQNFIGTYLATQYSVVSIDYEIDTFIQRYPSSPIYQDRFGINIDYARNFIWKWIGAVILSICLFVPILSLLTEIVRERQFLMKDLLDISGLMNSSYWVSYLVMILILGQISMWFCIGFYNGLGVIDNVRVLPYASLLTCYILGSGTFGMLFGFIVDRSEYYGLPTFLLTVALTVCGAYLAIADNITAPLKLFYCFLSPSVALTMGIIVIESYLYHHNGAMDYSYINENKQYPNLKDINGVIIAASIMYFGIILLLPFDWLFRHTNSMEMYIASKNDDIKYPCDNEEEEREANLDNDTAITEAQNTLLNVTSLSQVYPDGTHAVKDMNFRIKKGEVLSFLGANGAGKSTTMKMLCGTLDATYGDANVNGYSITTQRTLARRNLGIAMQQDIIWDDVNVEDHLMLFGRLRGLHGKVLRDAVTAMADSLGFPEKRKSLAGTLSGGQKRRLCVGLSMVGGNSVVYLDEPTAGLDPLSRRQLWDLVQRNREGRAILLTTHFMDEADVLGDRIAIVKEGRLRALGTSKFLKNRFGLGYLLRMSLRSDITVDPNAINDFVKRWIPECSIASNAGTELSLRLPRDAVSVFAEVFEQLETRSKDLGILSYGIETTTLEEVFMRIVNEDNEQLVADHDASNRMLSAPAEERDKNREELNKRDEQRNPLREDQISALLTKGDNSSTSICADSIGGQIVVMLKKRFFQFVRSRGQWAMGVGISLSIAVLASLLLSTMPSQLITSNYPEGFATVSNLHPTFVAGPTEQSTLSLMNDAFGSAVNPQYIGSNYSALYNTIDDIASAGFGETSLDGVVYDSLTNFTVIYNASYPINFPGLVQGMLNSAVANATDNMLVIDQIYNSLPHDKLNSQLNTAFYFAMLVSLIAGSFGAGLSIVVSGERVNLVKHQQLASGASTLAYWVGNFIFDSTLMGGYMFIFVAILALINPSEYGHEGYGEVILPGIFFVLATIFRNYSFSYFINDVKLAQSIYFYGSIAAVFILTDVWFQVLFNTAKCNISNSRVAIMSYIFTIIDPTFGWYLSMLYLNNFLGILTQHPNSNYFIQEIGGGLFISLIISSLLYGFIFIFITENAFGYIFQSIWNSAKSNLGNVSSSVNIRVKPMTLQEEEEYRNELSSATTVIPIPSSGIDQAITNKQDRSYGSQDVDVIQERLRVQKIVDRGLLNPNLSAIFIHDLRKVYYARGNIPAKVAVKNVNISIPQGEIFGLLGANGAGKTTLLKMVSGQESPSSGFALINGFDVVNQTNAAQRSMGLCPQFDTLVERLSVRENLLFFGRLKGLSATDLIPVVEAFMQAMNIKRYENKLIQHLSGGNRRKVSLTVALIGAPPTVYLDEPSTGLDPVACRLMWRLLSKIAASKSTAIVLTTHSMIECEAVCTRVCIMKLGEMVCLGDSQHLRSTHGTGFQLELNLKSSDGIELAKKNMLLYEIPRNAISRLSQTFKLLEDNKQTLLVDDYVLSQSTLEQVFLKQIRPNANDIRNQQDQKAISDRVPNFNDYVTVYIVWLLAAFIPGAHHFYLGNTWRGLKYFFTYNEVMAGWILDLFELHVLLQKSVQERGHVQGFLWCSCCNALWYIFCCFGCFGFFKAKATKHDHVHNTEEVEDGHNVVTAQPINDDAV